MTETKPNIDSVGKILNDTNAPLESRFRALFILRNLGGKESIKWIEKCLNHDSSALLKHELAYCLGQMQDKQAVDILIDVLRNDTENPMVRHEAGEALGALGDSSVLYILFQYANDPNIDVAQTCQLAVDNIKWRENENRTKEIISSNPYFSYDPAPPADQSKKQNISELKNILIDLKRSLWERYRALFELRNNGNQEAILALAQGLNCEDSALFRHEIAYVLGQIKSAHAIDSLEKRLSFLAENPMVRHECAEALGAIATEKCRNILEKYKNDQHRVVRESCEVALDMTDYENSDQFQYANVN